MVTCTDVTDTVVVTRPGLVCPLSVEGSAVTTLNTVRWSLYISTEGSPRVKLDSMCTDSRGVSPSRSVSYSIVGGFSPLSVCGERSFLPHILVPESTGS